MQVSAFNNNNLGREETYKKSSPTGFSRIDSLLNFFVDAGSLYVSFQDVRSAGSELIRAEWAYL